MTDLASRFAAAYNEGSIDSLTALLSDDATAQVIGSPFPVEEGRAKIAKTSFPHILDNAEDPMVAEVCNVAGEAHVLLREKEGDRRLDMVIHLEEKGDSIVRIEYFTIWHQHEKLLAIGRECNLSVRTPG